MTSATIAFLGAGNMARSIIAGLVQDGYDPKKVWAADRNQDKLDMLAQQHHIHTSADLATAISAADIVILAVKPQSLAKLASQIGDGIKQKSPLLISLVAGILVQDLARWFGTNTAIIRAMPNTPALLQAGATGLFANDNTSAEQCSVTESIMRAVGIVVWVEQEALMGAVVALAGSGPAYYFLFMEIMQQVGQEMGLDEKSAHLLTLQTAFGAAKLALESDEPLSTLRRQVTSKGGTTEAALNSFEAEGVRKLFKHAMQAAQTRSHELADQFGTHRKIDTQGKT